MLLQIDSRNVPALGYDLSHVIEYRGDKAVFRVPHYVWLLMDHVRCLRCLSSQCL